MKFRIPNINHSKVNRRTHAHTHTQTDRQTDRQTDKPKAICPSNFFKVGGIITPKILKLELWFLCMTHRLVVVYKCTKFH